MTLHLDYIYITLLNQVLTFYSEFKLTATLNEFFMLWRVRKKVSIPLKAPEAPLFEYVN